MVDLFSLNLTAFQNLARSEKECVSKFKLYPDLAALTAVVHLFLKCLNANQWIGSPVWSPPRLNSFS